MTIFEVSVAQITPYGSEIIVACTIICAVCLLAYICRSVILSARKHQVVKLSSSVIRPVVWNDATEGVDGDGVPFQI